MPIFLCFAPILINKTRSFQSLLNVFYNGVVCFHAIKKTTLFQFLKYLYYNILLFNSVATNNNS